MPMARLQAMEIAGRQLTGPALLPLKRVPRPPCLACQPPLARHLQL